MNNEILTPVLKVIISLNQSGTDIEEVLKPPIQASYPVRDKLHRALADIARAELFLQDVAATLVKERKRKPKPSPKLS
jgi:hypothetical protein